ncbi:hypothetical protein HMPREF0262_02118 [Clostridium sp. ATCC 29733]|nr:hypothetical protein HMPREF0262_02118 [Clostridium sp. ATCC 29733]
MPKCPSLKKGNSCLHYIGKRGGAQPKPDNLQTLWNFSQKKRLSLPHFPREKGFHTVAKSGTTC